MTKKVLFSILLLALTLSMASAAYAQDAEESDYRLFYIIEHDGEIVRTNVPFLEVLYVEGYECDLMRVENWTCSFNDHGDFWIYIVLFGNATAGQYMGGWFKLGGELQGGGAAFILRGYLFLVGAAADV